MSSCCRQLLSEGLDLCVRARKLDAQQRTNDLLVHSPDVDLERFTMRAAITDPDRPYMTRSGTIPLWIQDQYEKDLADWERRSRHHLTQGCPTTPPGEKER